MIDSTTRWVRWWCEPWLWAHTSWFPDDWPEDSALQRLSQVHHTELLLYAGIKPCAPVEMVDNALRWIDLGAKEQERALELARAIMCENTPILALSDSEDREWCVSVALALRPGRWPCAVDDAVVLLARWLGVETWARMQLYWPKNSLPDEIPARAVNWKALDMLWAGIIWRVQYTSSRDNLLVD